MDNLCLITSNCNGVILLVIQYLRNFLSRKPKCQDWVWFIVKIAGKIGFILYVFKYIIIYIYTMEYIYIYTYACLYIHIWCIVNIIHHKIGYGLWSASPPQWYCHHDLCSVLLNYDFTGIQHWFRHTQISYYMNIAAFIFHQYPHLHTHVFFVWTQASQLLVEHPAKDNVILYIDIKM